MRSLHDPADQWPAPDPPPPRRPLDQLERELCTLAADIAAATCRWLELVAEWDERQGWAEWGVKSCAHWLSLRCSIGFGAAREHVRTARALGALPLIRDSFRRGELSYCKVRALTRVADAATEQQLLSYARHASGAQLEQIVRGYRSVQTASSAASVAEHDRRTLDHRWNEDGTLSVSLRLPREDGALLLKALETAENWGASGEHQQFGERRADAFMELTRSAMETESRSGGDRCELTVHVDLATLRSECIHERCETKDGTVLAPETARRLGCDASIVPVLERDGRALSVGRRSRTVPAALRRALRARDRGCRYPGCTHTRFLHAHHVHHWARGGETSLANLLELCSFHHHLVHEGGYSVELASDGEARFFRPGGQRVAACVGSGSGSSIWAQNRRRGVCVDDRTVTGLSAGDRYDLGMAVEGLCAMRMRE